MRPVYKVEWPRVKSRPSTTRRKGLLGEVGRTKEVKEVLFDLWKKEVP